MDVNSMKDGSVPQIDSADIEQAKGISWLSYLGILFLIPMLTQKESAYAKFHVNQGIILCIVNIILSIVSVILVFIPGIGGILSLIISIAMLALIVIGIVNAATGKVKRLPIIGGFTIYK